MTPKLSGHTGICRAWRSALLKFVSRSLSYLWHVCLQVIETTKLVCWGMSGTRESSTETNYQFGYNTELHNQETALCTAKRLRQRFVFSPNPLVKLKVFGSESSVNNLANLVRIMETFLTNNSGLGRRYTGESSECSSIVGTPTESGRYKKIFKDIINLFVAQMFHIHGPTHST